MSFQEYRRGRIIDGKADKVVTLRNDGDNGNIRAGDPVQLDGSDDNACEQFDGSQPFVGVALWSLEANQDVGPPVEYETDDPVPVLKFGNAGIVVVRVAEAVSKDDDVAILDNQAEFAPGSTATTPNTAIDNAEFNTAGSAGENVGLDLTARA